MRELKFRAWNKKRKQMSDPFTLYDLIEARGMNLKPDDEFKNFITLQFTGLQDKNGVEIYEGDIVNLYNWGVRNKELIGTSVIEFDEDCGCWNTRKNIVEDQYDFYKQCLFKIIGNIYENPELLKQ